MQEILCGECKFENLDYKFDFRDNKIVLMPNNLEDYFKWYGKNLCDKKKYEMMNIEGITNNGKYICFIHIKVVEIGRGALIAWVPGYIICDSNGITPLPKCENIEKLIFYGNCIDKLYNPERIVKENNILEEKNLKLEIKNESVKTKFKVNDDIFCFNVYWTRPYSSDMNVVLKVKSFLEIEFGTPKNVDELVEYYLSVSKFFQFLNNRNIIEFNEIIATNTHNINYGININDVRQETIKFKIFINLPDEEFDNGSQREHIILEDIKSNFVELYKITSDKKYLTTYFPKSNKDERYVDNSKYIDIASAFESEFNKLYPTFKSAKNEEYKMVKDGVLKYLSDKREDVIDKINDDNDKKQHFKKIKKEIDYFYKIIEKIDGTLCEKINFSLNEYQKNISLYREKLLKHYEIEKISNGKLANDFVNRRNDISHGNGTLDFTNEEIICYELLRICIYCITLKRAEFNDEEIEKIVKRIFN